MRRAVVGMIVLGVLIGLVPSSPPAGAAGMTTHAWMAESAIDLVESDDLRALLEANLDQVRAGARFPDGGYGPGNVYGEEAHWQRFFDVHADNIRDKESCGDLTAPTGPCAAQVAHLLGAIGHGTGDEVWDWLFEPNSPDLDEYYQHPDIEAFNDHGGQELVMDLVAIGDHQRPGGDPPPLPFPDEILASLEESGQQGTTLEQLANGQLFIGIVYQAETVWAQTHLQGVKDAMPWMSANMVTAPGGVEYAAEAIAAQWDSMWGRLTGDQPDTEISATYPAPDQTGIPTGWVRESYQPGSHPGRGGARTRIAASVSYALPYRPPGGNPAATELPAGAMTLRERDTGVEIAAMGGFPKVLPYGPDAGTHTIGFQPAADLQPCTWYRVDVTSSLLDARGEPVVPRTWDFRTAQDPAGTACVDPVDPYDDYVERAYADVLGRPATAGDVTYWSDALEGGLSPAKFAASLVGSVEHRRHLVRLVYPTDLGRNAEPGALTSWSAQLATSPLDVVRAKILASSEAYTRAGGDAGAWVDHVYSAVLGRPADAGGRAYWVAKLGSGTTRGKVARHMAGSVEADRAIARQTLLGLLEVAPSAPELADATALVGASDVRALSRLIVGRQPYAPGPVAVP